jgi:cytochrome P450
MIPRFLRPAIAWIFILPNRWHYHKCAKYLIPLIKERFKLMKTTPEKEPNDFISWFTHEVADAPDPAERTPERLSLRIMTLNFAAIHTSTFTATSIIFDLFSAPPEAGYVTGIREEIEQLLKQNNGIWDKNVLAKMVKTDSAIRESLRISTFMSHGMDRMIVAPKGVTMNNGMHLPQGTRLATATFSIHHDNSVYEHALTYDAFRFSRVRETALCSGHVATGGASKEGLAKVLESKNLSTVTTSDTFLSFGHGRHACPGRFFAAMEMKLLVGYIVMNYDVEPMAVRPPSMFMGGTVLPPMKAKISVRRRAAGGVA